MIPILFSKRAGFLPHPRRALLGAALGAALSFTLTVASCLFVPDMARAQNATVPVNQLMAAQALPDIALGSENAPITIVEYASMTCTHCAAFHATTFPELKSKYIDTGKVRFILREFPLDPLATAAFMLARCAGPDKREAMVDLLFAQQKNWAFVDKPIEELANLLKQTGMSKDGFEACLKDKDLFENVNKVRNQAAKQFDVNATPTFFINGRKQNGELSPQALDALLQPLLKG
ncbi:DsbA family protein [Beijerinckia mobilis]|uniref:DsbA family protein n=1 Tax=Beijerinckia mobilis TaxID=231434 RepID=UPI000555BA73